MRIIIFLIIFLLNGCSVVNHYANREGNQPVNGRDVKKGTYTNDEVLYFPQENLQYLKEEQKKTDKYFKSAKLYNDLNYRVASSYLANYLKQLSVDTNIIEQEIENGHLNTNGKDLLDKMESGRLQTHPLTGNIKVMQWLKDNKDKISYPEYIAKYLDIYIPVKKKEHIQNLDFDDAVVDQSYALNTDNIRDYYVNYYLAWNEDFVGFSGKQVEFEEEPLQ